METKLQYSDMFDEVDESVHLLMEACAENNLHHVKLYIEDYKERIDELDAVESATCLILACQNGSLPMVQFLLEHGADVNKASINTTPLSTACEKDNLELVQFLLEKGANPNAYALFGELPLMEACCVGNYTMVEYLIEKGADVNKKDRDGNNLIFSVACMKACEKKDSELKIVRLLMAKGADTKARNKVDETPLQVAMFYKHQELIHILTEKPRPFQGYEMVEPEFVISTLSHFLKGPVSKAQYREFLSCITTIF